MRPLVSTKEGIIHIETTLNEITASLAMHSGSIFRIAAQHLRNWGIEVTPENEAEIKKRSKASYEREWTESGETSNRIIATATERVGMGDSNSLLNAILANVVVDFLVSMHDGKRRFAIGELGTGVGATPIAILNEIFNRGLDPLASYCDFYLIEPSLERLVIAKRAMAEHPAHTNFSMHATSDHSQFSFLGEGVFDMVVTNAQLHHHSDLEHLFGIHRILKDDGLFVLGDYHMSLTSHPAFMVKALKALQAEEGTLRDFMGFFGLHKGEITDMERNLTPEDRKANDLRVEYLRFEAEEWQKAGKNANVGFLEAYETVPEKIANLKKAGFEPEFSKLKKRAMFRKGFEGRTTNVHFLYPKTSVACVMAVGKSRQPPEKQRSKAVA